MPKPTKQVRPSTPIPARTLVVDNGAYTIKAGFSTPSPNPEKDCHIVPNCLARSRDKKIYIGAQLSQCKDFGEMTFRRPVEKGYIVNWEAEREVWESWMGEKDGGLKCDPHETNLLLAEAANAPAQLETNTDQIVFEDWEFAGYYRCMGPILNAWNDLHTLFKDPVAHPQDSPPLPVECCLVIDSGYSHTTVTPMYNGQPLHRAIRRLDIGGKFLTNYLKEIISLRHYNLMDETHLTNEVKETVCFVSDDFARDIERTWKGAGGRQTKKKDQVAEDGILVDYFLPDYNGLKSGYMKPHDPELSIKKRLGMAGTGDPVENYMTLGNERFTVPELLFNPADVGLKQAGVHEIVMQSLSRLPPGLWPVMLANVFVVGGNCQIPGFMERLEFELRQLAPAECLLRIARLDDPVTSTWLGGARLASNRDMLKEVMVTRQEYLEHGSSWLARKFATPRV